MTHDSFDITCITSYQEHLKTNICLGQEGVKCSEIARGHFSKIIETTHLPGTKFGTDKRQWGGYITRH